MTIFENTEKRPRLQWQPLQPEDPLYDNRLLKVGWDAKWVHVGSSDWNPSFRPDYHPRQMATMGIFGDAYWGDALGQQRAAMLPEGYSKPKFGTHYTDHRGKQSARINYHGRTASKPREWWVEKGLIFDADPLGWHEWFCWYIRGRRIAPYDAHQIQRWRGFVTRARAQLAATGHLGYAQALLHWAAAPT